MKRTMALCAAALVFAGLLQAHHSGSMYQPTAVWVKGMVVRFEGINPHTITTLEEQSADGQVRRWAVEGPGQSQFGRLALATGIPKVGDVIEFCAFPYKSVAELTRMFPGADFSARRWSPDLDPSPPQFVAGHVMVLPDGKMRMWEPHGLISECIRSSDDPRKSWLDFLNSDSKARQNWCEQRRYTLVQSNTTLRELVEEVDRLIDYPCK